MGHMLIKMSVTDKIMAFYIINVQKLFSPSIIIYIARKRTDAKNYKLFYLKKLLALYDL